MVVRTELRQLNCCIIKRCRVLTSFKEDIHLLMSIMAACVVTQTKIWQKVSQYWWNGLNDKWSMVPVLSQCVLSKNNPITWWWKNIKLNSFWRGFQWYRACRIRVPSLYYSAWSSAIISMVMMIMSLYMYKYSKDANDWYILGYRQTGPRAI